MDRKPVPSLLTPKQVSKRFNLKIRQVTELARQGRIPAVKVGRLWWFPEDSLRAWIEKNQTTRTPEAAVDLVVDEIIKDVNNERYLTKATA